MYRARDQFKKSLDFTYLSMGPRPCARPRDGVKIDGVGRETRKVRMYVYVCMYVCE